MFSCLSKGEKKKREALMKNGRMLLEELIASCDGKCNPIRTFSDKELRKATNNYDNQQLIVYDSDFQLYKGFLQDRPISVKKYRCIFQNRSEELVESAIRDIVIGSQMSVQKNVLKLIGCCLESTLPIVVYEFVGSEVLSNRIFSGGNCLNPLSWKSRIKIAADIANVLAYLHTALSRPVVLRDIRLSTIILGEEDCVPKLIDFSLSISIPDGESHLMMSNLGRKGFGAPEYIFSGYLTEKIDVFDFGHFALKLLTGEKSDFILRNNQHFDLENYVNHHVENQNFIEVVDPTLILNDDIDHQQLLAFGKIGLSCMCSEAEKRPTMTDVAKELKRMHQSIPPLL